MIYKYGKAISINSLEQGASVYGLFVLDQQGGVSFIDVINSPVTGDTSKCRASSYYRGPKGYAG